MIIRMWRGWTSRENADAYEALLREEITSESVNGAQTPGMLGIDVLRHDPEDSPENGSKNGPENSEGEVEFATIMTFEDWDAVRAFAGPDLLAAVVPDADRALLSRFDTRSRHYELLARNGVWK